MNSITVKAPAKVNLFLKVLSKRKDSYHNILTLFERISLADTIKISKIPKGITIKSDKPITRDPKDNLVYKAAEAVLKRGKIKSGVKIEIKKRIPVASGLGGGSSDAASTVIGINRMFRLRLDDKILLDIGRRLGADVPFFLLNTPFAIGRGRGDILEIVKSKAKFWHLIVKSGSKTATKDIYRAFDASVNSASNPEHVEGFDRTSKSLTLRQGSGSRFKPSPKSLTLRQGSGSRFKPSPKSLTPQDESVKIHPLLLKLRGRSQTRKQFGEGGQIPSKLRMGCTGIEKILYNDLERVVLFSRGGIGSISKILAQLLGKRAIVSGSGPSLFCLYRTRREAMRARKTVLNGLSVGSRRGRQIFVA